MEDLFVLGTSEAKPICTAILSSLYSLVETLFWKERSETTIYRDLIKL